MTKLKRKLEPLMSCERNDWQTPEVVLERVRRLGAIGLDPCTNPANPIGAGKYFTDAENGLLRSWWGHGLVFVNPPYGQIKHWAEKIASESQQATLLELVALVPARTDTQWWNRLVWSSAEAVCFWRGRLRFVGADNCAPFPSALIYFGRHRDEFDEAFVDAGEVVFL